MNGHSGSEEGQARKQMPVSRRDKAGASRLKAAELPELWQQQARTLCNDAYKRLWSSDGTEGLGYLHERGLKDKTIRAAALGYIESDAWDNPELWGLEDKKVYIPGPSVVIPRTVDGTICDMKFRGLTDKEPKYIQIRESQTTLYTADIPQYQKPQN